MATTTVRVIEANALHYRRVWRGTVITTFLNPILFLTAMGIILGNIIDRGSCAATLEGFSFATVTAGVVSTTSTTSLGLASSCLALGPAPMDLTNHSVSASWVKATTTSHAGTFPLAPLRPISRAPVGDR